MNKNKLITPEGTKDYLFEEAILRKDISKKLSELFDLRGYHEVVTPSLEFLDVYTTTQRVMPVENMYKLFDNKGRIMALRPDSTIPIARLCATRLKNQILPARLYYNQQKFSVSKSLKGSSDETMQAGIELIGVSNLKADVEVLTTAVEVMNAFGITDFRLEIGHIEVFNTLINSLDISDWEKEQIREHIESKNYPALNDFLDVLGKEHEISVIKALPRLFGDNEVFTKAKELIKCAKTLEILAYLENIYESLVLLGLKDKITVDLGNVSENEYYTGITFNGYVEGYGEVILSGGRYDKLLAEFGDDLGAIGFGVNVDSLVKTLIAKVAPKVNAPQILFFSEEEYQIKAMHQMREFRDNGVICEYSLADSLDEAKNYAAQKNIAEVYVVSENDCVKIKV